MRCATRQARGAPRRAGRGCGSGGLPRVQIHPIVGFGRKPEVGDPKHDHHQQRPADILNRTTRKGYWRGGQPDHGHCTGAGANQSHSLDTPAQRLRHEKRHEKRQAMNHVYKLVWSDTKCVSGGLIFLIRELRKSRPGLSWACVRRAANPVRWP